MRLGEKFYRFSTFRRTLILPLMFISETRALTWPCVLARSLCGELHGLDFFVSFCVKIKRKKERNVWLLELSALRLRSG
jgi:hypothetical protein